MVDNCQIVNIHHINDTLFLSMITISIPIESIHKDIKLEEVLICKVLVRKKIIGGITIIRIFINVCRKFLGNEIYSMEGPFLIYFRF